MNGGTIINFGKYLDLELMLVKTPTSAQEGTPTSAIHGMKPNSRPDKMQGF